MSKKHTKPKKYIEDDCSKLDILKPYLINCSKCRRSFNSTHMDNNICPKCKSNKHTYFNDIDTYPCSSRI